MKIETLKELVKKEFDRNLNMTDTRGHVMRLLELFEEEQDNTPTPHTFAPFVPTPGFIVNECRLYGIEPDQVPYGEICSCNPKNGGSGICGCIMGNKMIPNPKKHGYGTNYTSTTTDITNSDFSK